MNPSALPRMKQHASVHSAEYLTKLNKLLSLVKNKTPQINPDPEQNAKKKTHKLRKSLKVWDEKAVNLIYSGSVANTAVNHKKSSAAFVNKKKIKKKLEGIEDPINHYESRVAMAIGPESTSTKKLRNSANNVVISPLRKVP
jgi:hypothetical protein